jgi:hypothetical protein
MMWADVIASSSEDDGCDNSWDVDALHDYKQSIPTQ